MSASTFDRRARSRDRAAHALRRSAGHRDAEPEAPRRSWIGVDFAGVSLAPRSRTFVPLIVVALVAALGISALRIDLIRTRYALAANLAQEQSLVEEQRALIVRLRGLRDPSVLAALARERGYRPADRVIALADPMPGPLPGTDPAGALSAPRGFADVGADGLERDIAESPGGRRLPAVSAGPPAGGPGIDEPEAAR